MAQVEWHGDEIVKKARQAAKEGLHQAGELVAKKWQDDIPWATGDLGGHIAVNDTEDATEISSSGPYAAVQEFDETLRHPDPTNPLSLAGRKAHAGRDALNDNQDQIAKLIAAKVKEALK